MSERQKNLLGLPLVPCSMTPRTGFFRTGCCETGPEDRGAHVVCVVTTEAFLTFSRQRGNALSTPHPEHGFPGLRPGDRALFQVGSNSEIFVALFGCFKAGVLPVCSLPQFRLRPTRANLSPPNYR